jgi:hypothetical protein
MPDANAVNRARLVRCNRADPASLADDKLTPCKSQKSYWEVFHRDVTLSRKTKVDPDIRTFGHEENSGSEAQ